MIGVNTNAHLYRNWDPKWLRRLHCSINYRSKEFTFIWKRRSPTFARDLWNWTTKVHINVIS